jgi:hypothetical protein
VEISRNFRITCYAMNYRLYVEITQVLENAFREIERLVPPPAFVSRGSYNVFRYENQSVEAAVVQKCARLISGLNASLVLLRTGYVQELGALFRMLDEFNEDILFLCQAIRNGELTELHRKFLEAFYQEEFDKPDNAFLSTQSRPMIPRRKILAAIARIPEQELNPSDCQELHRSLSQAYSGFVHAASPQVMDMYGGDPPRFHVSGMQGTPRIPEFEEDAWNYHYRALLSIMMVALSFKQHELLKELYAFRGYVEQKSRRTEWEHPEALVDKEKSKKA